MLLSPSTQYQHTYDSLDDEGMRRFIHRPGHPTSKSSCRRRSGCFSVGRLAARHCYGSARGVFLPCRENLHAIFGHEKSMLWTAC